MDDELIDLPQAARELGVSERQIWRLLQRTAIPRYTLPARGKRVHIARRDLDALRQPAAPITPAAADLQPQQRPRSAPESHGDDQRGQSYTKMGDCDKSEEVRQAVRGVSLQEYEWLRTRLRELRQVSGIRQTDLARRLRQPQNFVSKYELGQRRLDLLEVRRICQELGVSFVDFVARLDQELDEPAEQVEETTD